MIRLPRKRSGAIQTPAFADIARHDWSILSPTQPQGDDWTTTGTPTLMGTPHGLGWRLGTGNYYNAVDVVPFSGGAGGGPDWLVSVTFVVTSNAATDPIFSIGGTETDGGPVFLFQNNAGVLRQLLGSYTNLAPSIIGQLCTVVVTYSDVSPYPRRVYLNDALVHQSSGYLNVGNKNFYVGSGFPGQTANAVILQAAMAVGRGANYVNARGLSEDHRLILPHKTRGVWVPVSAGGGTVTLAAQDAAHAHALDNAALSIGVTLTVADLAHGHALDASTLSTGTALAVADSLHAHALDNVTLSTTGAVSLTVADSLHAHTLDAVVLTSQTDLAAADMAHGHALDGVTLTLGGISLVIAEIMHAHALDAVALTLDTYLAVADLLHGHAIDNVLVSIPGGTLDLILKILRNRQELNPTTGKFTLYDDDGTTILKQSNAWADVAGTRPYSGGTLARIDALI